MAAAARQIVADNGLAGVVTVIQGRVEDAEIPVRMGRCMAKLISFRNDLTPALILQIGKLRRRAAQRVDGLLPLLRGDARLRPHGQVGYSTLR